MPGEREIATKTYRKESTSGGAVVAPDILVFADWDDRMGVERRRIILHLHMRDLEING